MYKGMNEADLIFGKVPFIFMSTYCQSWENRDGCTAAPRCLSELHVYSLPVASSSPDARLELRGDPQGLGAPPGKGSSVRIFPGNICFPCRRPVLGLGIVGGQAVLSEATESGLQAPGSPSSSLPFILLDSFTPQWERGTREPPARKPFVSVRAAPTSNTNECLSSFYHGHTVLSHSAHRVLHSSQQPWHMGPTSQFELLPPRNCGKAFPTPLLCLLQESSWITWGPRGTIRGARLTGAICFVHSSIPPSQVPAIWRALTHYVASKWFIEHLLSARALRENLRLIAATQNP